MAARRQWRGGCVGGDQLSYERKCENSVGEMTSKRNQSNNIVIGVYQSAQTAAAQHLAQLNMAAASGDMAKA